MMISVQKSSLAVTVVKTCDEELSRALREIDKTSNNSRLFIYTMTHQIANICWIRESKRLQKSIYFVDGAKIFDCVDHNKPENSSRDGHTRPPYLPLEKPVCRSRSNS